MKKLIPATSKYSNYTAKPDKTLCCDLQDKQTDRP